MEVWRSVVRRRVPNVTKLDLIGERADGEWELPTLVMIMEGELEERK